MTKPHPMMADSNHDELAEQQFVMALKTHVFGELDPIMKANVDDTVQTLESESETVDLKSIRRRLSDNPDFQNWVGLKRSSQELMWQTAGDCVDRQHDELLELASQAPKAGGSVRVDPNFEVPRYLAASDTHMMPGSYYGGEAENDLRQGAVFDKGASLYALGRQGGVMSEMRGHTVIAHLFERFGDLEPKRILEMGCTVGNSLVGVARYFPEAEVHGIDVGAGLLRYAHARAEYLGVPIHFSQQSAEQTDFEGGSFDLVFSSAVLHETSAKAMKNIFAECHRLLRPGGVMIHLEVPLRAEDLTPFEELIGDFEARYNNEPFWAGLAGADLAQLGRDAGFTEVAADFQDARIKADRNDEPGFGKPNKGAYRSWYIVSGRR